MNRSLPRESASSRTRPSIIFTLHLLIFFLAATALAAAAPCALNPVSPSVTICTPTNGTTVTSPVSIVAGTTDTAHPVTAMILYVDNVIAFKVNANQLSTSISPVAGKHNLTVNAWDSSGAVFKSTVIITVSGTGTPPVSVAVTPSSATLAPGLTQQFSATVLNATNKAVTWSVDGLFNGNITVGTITTSGLYTAPATNGTHSIVATSVADPSKSDTAIVTVTSSGGGGGGPCSPTSGPPSVTICSPASGATVTSPVQISAVGNSSTPITKMLVYIDNVQQFQTTTSSSVNTSLALAAGTHNLTVQFYTGAWIKQSEKFIVSGGPASPTVSISASPASISSGASSTLTVTAMNATSVVVTNNIDATTYNLSQTGGTQSVTPTQTATYTATATGAGGTSTASTTVTVSSGNAQAIQHVIFMLQENRTFDTYFGMLNPYRMNNGWNVGDDGKQYNVDGIDDKLSTITNVNDEGTVFPLFKTTSTCLDDMTSSWLESYGDVNRYDFSTTRKIQMDGYVHVAENFAKFGAGSGSFTDLAGQRAMAYYDEGFLNYYYYMASQFALSDRWFSPVSSKSTPNRIATFTGGTTQGLVFDPFTNDRLPTLAVKTIFQELDSASPAVSWKIYYSLASNSLFPETTFSDFGYSGKYLYSNASQAPCVAPTVGSKQAVGDASNAFCIDPNHIASLSQFFTDAANGTLPSFAFIEAGFGRNDEHPGSGQSILQGQAEAAKVVNSFMNSPSWKNSVFFLSYDEGGGSYDHVPPVPGHTNDFTAASLGITTDISSIAVNPDSYGPCLPPVAGTPTQHCDLVPVDPGAKPTDTAAVNGFKAQLGFRLPNMIVSPFTRKHYVSHTPMDHTAVIRFVENRFIGPGASLTPRDAAQPDLMEFFDFTAIPWSVPPTPPAPVTDATGSTCTPASMGP
ncbi:MAG TPA: alkaline phosphatase family protein [Candidatus Saccharimonadales bacterium]|nr:alkaline phosphatase family protein [Candidatus Saccharimonadales bacterium]